MIAYLKGQVLEIQTDILVLAVAGVGYEAHCSLNTLAQFQIGQTAELFIYTHVREDAFQLFGFSTKSEKELFLALIKVNGVGPKVALNILSATTAEAFVQLIESEDVKGLSQLPKVGKKTAEQLILSLRGKLVSQAVPTKQVGVKKDIFSALVNLGFKDQDVQKILSDMPEKIEFEEGVRKGLQTLSGQ